MASIAVIGGGLAGLAAAVRLAKLKHQVTLFEAGSALGGVWSQQVAATGEPIDPTPAVIGFPAPWRDLFRKSGRPLEAELSRRGLDLLPAAPTRYAFADGSELSLPAGREEHAALEAAYGTAIATAWRVLVDRFDPVWQALRPLGYEADPTDPRDFAAADRLLQPWRTVADVAAAAPHPHLGALVRSIAYRLGAEPERTPARAAVELSIRRTFGAWSVTDGRTDALVDLLADRLALRGVEVRLSSRIAGIETAAGRAVGQRLSDGSHFAADAIICTTDPWQLVDTLLSDPPSALARSVRRLRPALAPALSSTPTQARTLAETVRLDHAGVPVVSYDRPGRRTEFDFASLDPDPAWGVRWRAGRWRSAASNWRPTSASGISGIFLAGASGPAGSMPSAVVCSAALAATRCHDYAQMSVFSG